MQLDNLTSNRRTQALDPLQLANHPLTLLALTANHRYRLSGSLYYCPQGDTTTCLLASVQQELVPTSSPATTAAKGKTPASKDTQGGGANAGVATTGGRAEGSLTITLP